MKRYRLAEDRLRGIVYNAVKGVLKEAAEPEEEEYYGEYDEPSPSGNDAIEKWNYWCANYQPDFIERAWAHDKNLAKHLRGKFDDYYDSVGPYGVMLKFYLNLSGKNQAILADYVMNNFEG